MNRRRSLFRLFTQRHVHGLVTIMLAAFTIQIILLAVLLQNRNKTISEATQIFTATDLVNITDFANALDPSQRALFIKITNTPYAHVEFRDSLPESKPIAFLGRLIGLNVSRIDITLEDGQFMVVGFDKALQETIGFFGQIGMLILFFFLVLGFVLMRAQAAIQPVHQFALAAKRLSQDLHAPPMEIRSGSQDLIEATEAINRMQTALQGQVTGRMRLIAGIGHDLRTFITRLTLRAEFITDAEQKKKALQDLEQMVEVVNQSLELGKGDDENDPLEQIDLADCLFQLVEGFTEMGKPVTISSVPSVPVAVRKTALRRAFNNLIENAIRYGHVAHVSAQKNRREVHIHIDDEGPGIPEDKRAEVIKPYVRLEKSRNRDTGGTGLGLPIAHLLINRQGGELILSNAPTGGLRATISLQLSKKHRERETIHLLSTLGNPKFLRVGSENPTKKRQ